MNNKLKILFVMVFLFNFCVVDVKAVVEIDKRAKIEYNSSYNVTDYYDYDGVGCGDGVCTFYKIDKNDNDVPVYCAEYDKLSPNNNTNLNKVSNFSSDKGCFFVKSNGTRYDNIDCSSMVGYIIHYANEAGSNSNYPDAQKYLYSQLAIQTYLYNYGSSTYYQKKSNEPVAGLIDINVFRTILNNAYNAYASVANVVNASTPSVDFRISFKINGTALNNRNNSNNELYAMNLDPSNGYYSSYRIDFSAIRQYDGKTVDYKLESNDPNNVQFCLVNGSCSSNLQINPGDQFWVKTKRSDRNFKITVSASVDIDVSSSSTIYDSERFSMNNDERQDVIKLKVDTETTSGTVSVTDSTSFNLYPKPVYEYTCEKLYSESKTDPNPPIVSNVGCDSNNISKNWDERYNAVFQSCIVKEIDIPYYLPSNSSDVKKAEIGIVVNQKGDFLYGPLNPSTSPLYAGGGFGLGTTYYLNQVAWRYRFVKSNGNFYINYGNNENEYVSDNTTICVNIDGNQSCGTAYRIITNTLNKLVAEGINIKNLESDLKNNTFVSYSSDIDILNVDDFKRVPVVVTSNYSDVINDEWSDGKYLKILYKFELNDAYKNIENNIIDYSGTDRSADDNYLYYGKNYYTYLKSQLTQWPFNVDTSDINLSSIEGIEWKLCAECLIDLNNPLFTPDPDKPAFLQLHAHYRSIDVKDPFPRGTTDTKWSDWYGISSNKSRLENSYTDEQIDYRFEISKNSINSVSNYNAGDYASWRGINKQGHSSFIDSFNNNFDGSISVTDSYCALGEFKEECDK